MPSHAISLPSKDAFKLISLFLSYSKFISNDIAHPLRHGVGNYGPMAIQQRVMQALTADYRKNHLTFQIFNYSCFSTATTKWNTAAIKIPLLFETGLFILFFGWGKRRHGIQRKWLLNRQGLTAEYRKGSDLPGRVSMNNCLALIIHQLNWFSGCKWKEKFLREYLQVLVIADKK